jgi:CBS domain-containing protein
MKLEIPNQVSEVMSRDVLSVEESDTLTNLLSSLKALRFRHLPVTDDDRLIGLVTLTDLLGVASTNLLPHHTERDRMLLECYHVRDIMVRDVATVRPETSLREASRLLWTRRLGCLPVVDEAGALVGMLTASDFVKIIAQPQLGTTPYGSGEPEQLQ